MRAIDAVSIAVAGVAALFLALPPEQVAGEATPAPCVWEQEFLSTLADLGEDVGDWSAWDTIGENGGMMFPETMTATVNPNAKCAWVSSIVRHEYAHLQQFRMYGSGTREHYGSNLERVADCASKLMGSRVTPYLDPDHPAYTGPCTVGDYQHAQRIIEYRGGGGVR